MIARLAGPMKTIRLLMIAAALSPAVVACATQGADPAASLDRFTFTGEKINCLSPRDITGITPLDETAVLFRARVNKLYINRVGPGCNGADNAFRRLQYDVNAGSLCRNETLQVVDNNDNLTAGFCRLGAFEEVTENSDG